MSLTVAAPTGAHFAENEVSTSHGQTSLGTVPILVWDDVAAAREFYGDEGIIDALDGTSFRVAFQAIARRNKIAGKSDDEIAEAQLKYRPGKRSVGAPTPVSRAKKSVEAAAATLGDKADLLQAIMDKIASGQITAEEAAAFVG